MHKTTMIILALLLVGMNCYAAEAPDSMEQFNIICPANKLRPAIDNHYHECHSGMIRNEYNSCEKFIEIFKELMPEFDCARPIDISGTKKYTVPAIWLLGDGQFSDYHSLVHDLVFKKMYSGKEYVKARKEASELFFSSGFKRVLDAGGEEYEDEWNAHEQKILIQTNP